MLIKPDCIPCILRMSISAIRQLPLDENAVKELCGRILENPSLRGRYWDITSVEVIEFVMKEIIAATGAPDPFSFIKSEQNKRAMAIYPSLKKLVDAAPDPLFNAVKLAILGNSIDLMMADEGHEIENSITERLAGPLSKESYEGFKARLRTSNLLLYFADNSGEIVFDKLLIETMKKLYDPEVVFVVRNGPALNDATLKEARFVGMDKVANVVQNGIDGPLPGTILRRCSGEVREAVDKADLIISKGGGNFDTLDEERKRLKNNITFMLLSKCHPYYDYFGIELNQPILANL